MMLAATSTTLCFWLSVGLVVLIVVALLAIGGPDKSDPNEHVH